MLNKMNKREQKIEYSEWKRRLSNEFELCEECKSKIPNGMWVSSDNGSGTMLLYADEKPLGNLNYKECKEYEKRGYIRDSLRPHLFLCNDCYMKNTDRRELIRQIYIAYTLNIDFYHFKIAIEGVQHWVTCTKKNKST